MKKQDFPDLNAYLNIYGPDELEKFCKKYRITCQSNELALSFENAVWIGEPTIELCAHESTHFVDWLLEDWLDMKQGTLESNAELRAYLVGKATQAVWDYVSK